MKISWQLVSFFWFEFHKTACLEPYKRLSCWTCKKGTGDQCTERVNTVCEGRENVCVTSRITEQTKNWKGEMLIKERIEKKCHFIAPYQECECIVGGLLGETCELLDCCGQDLCNWRNSKQEKARLCSSSSSINVKPFCGQFVYVVLIGILMLFSQFVLY
eukprot:TCONS_00073533-protein